MLDIRPLRSSTFRHLATAYTINELGNWVGDVALAVLVFDRTHSPLATASLFLALRVLPALVAPLVATRLETLPARRIVPALYVGEAAIFGALAILSSHFVLAIVLALTALDGVLGIASKALMRSATAAGLVKDGLLREGNAILNLGFTTGGAAGPALAGLVVATGGPSAALWLDSATFVGAAVALATATQLRLVNDRDESARGRLRNGIYQVLEQPGLRRLVVALAFIFLFNAVAIPIEVVFVKRTLHDGDTAYGLLLGAWGAGMILGGALFSVGGRLPQSWLLVAGGAAMVAGYAGLAASPDLLVACGFSALGGLGNGCGSVAAITAVQEAVSLSSQSAVMALLGALDQAMPAIGFILGGVVTVLGSPRTAYAVAAAGMALVLTVCVMASRTEQQLVVPAGGEIV